MQASRGTGEKKSGGSQQQRNGNVGKRGQERWYHNAPVTVKKMHYSSSVKAQQLLFAFVVRPLWQIDIQPRGKRQRHVEPGRWELEWDEAQCRLHTSTLAERDWPLCRGTRPALCAEQRNGKQMPHKMPWHGAVYWFICCIFSLQTMLLYYLAKYAVWLHEHAHIV